MRRSVAALLSLGLIAGAGTLAGQSCFRGQPTCRQYWITETGVAMAVSPPSRPLLSLEVGRMSNRSSRWALGGTAFFDIDDQFSGGSGGIVGVKPRVRRWMGRRIAVELGAGPFLIKSDRRNNGAFGFAGQLGISLNEWVGVNGQLLTGKRQDGGPSDTAFYLGARLGSYPGAIAGIPALVLWLLAIGGAFRG